MQCLMRAWDKHETELRAWLVGKLGNRHDAEDMLQNLFLKAIRQQQKFCELKNARAWLFRVARNALADHLRLRKDQVELPDEIIAKTETPAPVASLAQCLPRTLAELSEEDREVITYCDLEGMTQEDYAKLKGISLPGAKSRIQRARRRLREHLTGACQVRFDETGNICCFVPRTSCE